MKKKKQELPWILVVDDPRSQHVDLHNQKLVAHPPRGIPVSQAALMIAALCMLKDSQSVRLRLGGKQHLSPDETVFWEIKYRASQHPVDSTQWNLMT